jgi:hypothetical protein
VHILISAIFLFFPFYAQSQITIHDKGTGVTSSIGIGGSTTKSGRKISAEELAKFETDKSTYDEVIASLGKPTGELIEKSANMLIVYYKSQTAEVKSNTAILSAIPIFGSLANTLAGKTELKAEDQQTTFIFDLKTKILMDIKDDRDTSEAKSRSGIELIKDVSIGIGEKK